MSKNCYFCGGKVRHYIENPQAMKPYQQDLVQCNKCDKIWTKEEWRQISIARDYEINLRHK